MRIWKCQNVRRLIIKKIFIKSSQRNDKKKKKKKKMDVSAELKQMLKSVNQRRKRRWNKGMKAGNHRRRISVGSERQLKIRIGESPISENRKLSNGNKINTLHRRRKSKKQMRQVTVKRNQQHGGWHRNRIAKSKAEPTWVTRWQNGLCFKK